MSQLSIPIPQRPDLDEQFVIELARLDATLAYRHARNHARTVKESVKLVVKGVLNTNWAVMYEYFECHGIMPYVGCTFLRNEIVIHEEAQTGYITQYINDKESMFMDCDENFVYDDKTMNKIRARVEQLFEALAIFHERKQEKDRRDAIKAGMPF